MNFDSWLASTLGFSGGLGIQTAIVLFLVCLVGELAFPIPYVLESVWLLAGYYLGARLLTPWNLALLWLIAQVGRQAGSTGLYFLAGLGTNRLTRIYRRLRISRYVPEGLSRSRAVRRISNLSPFSAAYSRLLGLRIPLAFVAAAKHRWKTLSTGVVLSSIIWDGAYVSIGLVAGSRAVLSPLKMLAVSIGGLTAIYVMTVGIRALVRRLRSGARTAGNSDKGA
ncbi:MAG: hypothetical protein HYX87_02575 [Chloroflexi bacterium]|nr:hypothetical protein [Chloroflexota bacterium]